MKQTLFSFSAKLNPFAVCVLILFLVCNFYLYNKTVEKIEKYKKTPPFFSMDFSRPHSLFLSAPIRNLTDGNLETFWEKANLDGERDFEVELNTTHIVKREQGVKRYVPIQLSKITIHSCTQKPTPLAVTIFLREAIHIDQEKRLPKEVWEWKKEIILPKNDTITIDLPRLPLEESDVFPKNLFILGLAGKTKEPKLCIQEIKVF